MSLYTHHHPPGHEGAAGLVGTLLAFISAWVNKSLMMHDVHTIGISLVCAACGWFLTRILEYYIGHIFKKQHKNDE